MISKIKKPNTYETFLLEALNERRFMPGQELTQLLQKRFDNIDQPYARKILQRALLSGFVHSSKPFTFGKGQFIYLHPDQWINKEIIQQISAIYRPPLYRLLRLLDESSGIISYYEAMKVTASPEEQTSSKVNSLQELLQIVVDLGIVVVRNDENGVRYLVEKKEAALADTNKEIEKAMLRAHYSNMVMDTLFIPDILRWLQKINLVSLSKSAYRSKTAPAIGARHNGLVWDAYSYTKTTGINPLLGKYADTNDKQTLVALDVVVSREYSQVDLDGFLSRIQLHLHSVKSGIRKVMPIVVYRSCSAGVLNKMNALGFLSFDIGIIFGTRIYEVVNKLGSLNPRGRRVDEESLEQTTAWMIDALRQSGQEDNLHELKGVLFEFLLYPLLKNRYPDAEISHGRVLKKKDGETNIYYEYDYIIRTIHPKEIILVELKGYSAPAVIYMGDQKTKNTLRWFFRKTVPFAKDYFEKEVGEGYQIKACFITTAKFYPDGLQFLDKINSSNLKPLHMDCYYNGEKLLTLLTQFGFTKIRQTIERFYLQNEIN